MSAQVTSLFEEAGKACSIEPGVPIMRQTAVVPIGHAVATEACVNNDEKNNVCEVYFQLQPDGARSAIRNNRGLSCTAAGLYPLAMVDLLEQIISEPYFDQLRTKEQLGYCMLLAAVTVR